MVPNFVTDHYFTQKRMTVEAVEFVRRFLLHVLPAGFVKIHRAMGSIVSDESEATILKWQTGRLRNRLAHRKIQTVWAG
jgi:hypothetical protein